MFFSSNDKDNVLIFDGDRNLAEFKRFLKKNSPKYRELLK
jgi:hypothetical protein